MIDVFHKYRGDSRFTESIITSGKVFLATAHQLNDPFECSLQAISKEWLDEKITLGMQSALTGFFRAANVAIEDSTEFLGLQPSGLQKAFDTIKAAGTLEGRYDAYRTFIFDHTGHLPSEIRGLFHRIDEQLVETGIFSMSVDPAQALMWAHYGDQHRGLCLGFQREPGSKLDNPDHCLPVMYSDELPKMEGDGLQTSMATAFDDFGRPYTSSLKLAFSDKTFQRVVTTKPTCWAYEKEYRYIEPFGGLCDWPGVLAECTFGLRCHDNRREHFIGLLEAHVPNEVHLFEIQARRGANGLERVPLVPLKTRPRISSNAKPVRAREPEQMQADDFANRMQQLIQQERYGEVIFQTGENLEQYPSDPTLLHLKATAHGRAQDHSTAYDLYQQLAELYPNVAAGWYGMACALEATGQNDQVIPLLRRACELAPDEPSATLNLGVHLARNPETRPEGMVFLRRAEKLGHRRARVMIDYLESEDRPP